MKENFFGLKKKRLKWEVNQQGSNKEEQYIDKNGKAESTAC